MSRRLTIDAFCDACEADGEQDTPAVVTFTAGLVEGEKPHPVVKLLDLCEAHGKDLRAWADLVKAAPTWTPGKTMAVGTVVPSTETRPVRQQTRPAVRAADETNILCPICRSVYPRKSIISHVRRHAPSHLDFTPPLQCPDCTFSADKPVATQMHRVAAHHLDVLRETLELIPGWDGEMPKGWVRHQFDNTRQPTLEAS